MSIVKFHEGGFADFVHFFGDVVALLGNLDSGVCGLVVLNAECHLVIVVADGDAQVALGVLTLQGQHVACHLALFDVVAFLETIEDGNAEA